MKDKFLSKAVSRGTRTIWRYLSALFILFSLSIGQMWGAVYKTYALSDLTYTAATLTYEVTGLSGNDQKLNKGERKVEVPCASASGTLYLSGTGANAGRYASIWGSNGTAVDATRKIAMTSGYGSGISFTSDDILTDGEKYYIIFSNVDGSDYKINAFKYVLSSACGGGSDPVPVSSVSVTAPVDGNTYYVGDQVTLAATVLPDNATDKTLNWTMDVSDKATIADGKITFTEAGDFHLTASATDGSGKSNKVHLYVSNPSPVCPAGLSIDGTHAYTEGETISLNATLGSGNGSITYNWYKGADSDFATAKAAGSIGTGATLTINSCTPSDAGYYWCEATKTSCEAAHNGTEFVVSVDPISYCAELNPATSGDEPVLGTVIAMQTGSYGGSIKVVGRKQSGSFAYTANGLTFNKGGVDSVRVTLNHLIKKDTKIYVTVNNQDGSKDQGFYLQNLSKTKKADMHRQNGSTGDTTYVYTADNGDGLVGVNEFIIARGASSAALKSLKISNCGAELFALTSAIDPVAAEGKATITLSKTLVAAGGTATATYTISDPTAYDFDEWQISGATIDNAKANPVTITMGSTDATITLKLKEAGVKYAVHFDSKGGSAVDDQLVDKDGHASVPTAPTKFKYTFGGWSETDGGAAADLASVAITAEKTFYAIWTPKVCPTSGTIYSFVSDGTKAPGSNTYCPASGVQGVVDIAAYATVSGGLAQGVHTTTSNNPIQIQTSTSAVKLSHADGYFRALLECPLQIGDTIKFGKTNKIKMAFDSLRTKVVDVASGTGVYIVPTAYAGEDTIMIYHGGSSVNLTSLQVIRPEKFAVTFNMHGHGTQVEPQNILEGGKVTEPATTDITGWDFGGWYKTYVAEPESYSDAWDFENDVVSAATELHAKWTEHVASSDATLSSLTVNGEAITLEDGVFDYAFELPMGTTALPTIVAVPNDSHSKGVSVVQTNIGSATITVTAEDDSFKDYTITFTVATSKAIQLVFKTGTTPCVGSASTATQILSNNAAVSTYINQITFTNVEGAGDDGAEGSSLNVGKKAGNMFTLSAKPGYAFQAMNFLAKIQDASCEYSTDGSDWTELTSTNTEGDECYAPFSGTEVHEFRLRSTGNQGVWIRNMQLTLIEACTPIVVAWDEEPVEFEVGKAGYAIAATANNGGTITYASADNTIIDANASTGALTIAGLGSVALSASTPEGDGTTYCANGGDPIVLNKTVNTYYLVTFDGQNGEAADEVKYFSGDDAIALPDAPTYAGYDFQGWFDAETGGNKYTAAITPAASMTVYAQWVAQCAGATITTQPEGTSYLTGRTATALVCEATAGAGGALTYEWFTCDDEYKANPVAATAMPSTAVAGTFYYFCKVTEEGCAVEAFSDVVTITVADKDPICLAWVDVTGQNAVALDASKSLYAPEVSAANLKNTSSYGGKTGYKFNARPAYIAIENAPFKSGDIVEMFVTTIADNDKARVFKANEAQTSNVIAEGAENMVQGANRVVITEDANSLYLRRGNDEAGESYNGWNPYVAYVAVYRACAPILNSVTVAGVEAAPDNTNHVAIEVPFSTTDDALDAIVYDWVSNNDAWTAAHAPAVANTWEWGVENTVTFTDKDNDQSVYYITISKAEASSDATLSSLTYGTPATAIALADGVYEYNVELPYGTSDVPALAATKNHVGATIVSISDAAAFVDRKATSTVTVKAEDATTIQVYTVNFAVSRYESKLLWDGSTMTQWSDITAAAAAAGVSITSADISVTSFSPVTCEENGKSYTKALNIGGNTKSTRYFGIEIPAGKVAKVSLVYKARGNDKRSIIIGTAIVGAVDESAITSVERENDQALHIMTADMFGGGTLYINTTNGFHVHEISLQLADGHARSAMLGNGVLGTVCVPNNVAVEDIQGVTVYELVGRDYTNYGKLAFDEITSGELEEGVPYVFLAHRNHMALLYGETSVAEPVDKGNGMYGTFVDQTLTELNDIYYFAQRALWSCVDLSSLSVPANRAYVKLGEIGEVPSSNPNDGRRRILLSVNGENQTQGVDNLESGDQPMKVMIDGTLYIIRGEKVFDATGRLVK